MTTAERRTADMVAGDLGHLAPLWELHLRAQPLAEDDRHPGVVVVVGLLMYTT